MESMFTGATSFSSDLSAWQVGQVTNMANMFKGARSFSSDLSAWQVGQVTRMNGMFWGDELLERSVCVAGWAVTTMTAMSATSRRSVRVAGWASQVYVAMFRHARSFSAICPHGRWARHGHARNVPRCGFSSDLSHGRLGRSRVWTACSEMRRASRRVSAWQVGQVTNTNGMFNGATSFSSDVSAWQVGQVTNTEACSTVRRARAMCPRGRLGRIWRACSTAHEVRERCPRAGWAGHEYARKHVQRCDELPERCPRGRLGRSRIRSMFSGRQTSRAIYLHGRLGRSRIWFRCL